MSKDKTKTADKTDKKQATERKERTPDTRPGPVIFAERFNDELRQMSRRFDNLNKLAVARKAHGTPAQVEAGIKWMTEQLEATARKLRESVTQHPPTTGPAAKEAFSIVPATTETPSTDAATEPAKA